MNTPLRDAIDRLFRLCDEGRSEAGAGNLSAVAGELTKEFLDMVSYLSASDGLIVDYEADFLKTYFDLEMSAEDIRSHIEQNNTYSLEFEQRVPQMLAELVERDNMICRHPGETDISLSKTYCTVFECTAKEFLVCDGNASEAEVADMVTYISMLNDYREKNYTGNPDAQSAVDASLIHPGENPAGFTEAAGPCSEASGTAGGNSEETLEELLKELNGLVGLDSVKKDVSSLIHLQRIQRLRRTRGLKEIPVSNHLVFYGNPGTGKTTVARLLARIYYAMGILSKREIVEVDRSALVAGYVGQTALKTQKVIESAMGGVLFIDEAYTLTYNPGGNDFGQEAIDTLLKAMEDHREDFVVIVSGYPDLMAKFINSNPGLRSRFNKYIRFEDYNAEELLQIYERMCDQAGYRTADDATAYVADVFREKYEHRQENFANAREVRNFFETVVTRQADRLFSVADPSNEELCTLLLEDVVF